MNLAILEPLSLPCPTLPVSAACADCSQRVADRCDGTYAGAARRSCAVLLAARASRLKWESTLAHRAGGATA